MVSYNHGRKWERYISHRFTEIMDGNGKGERYNRWTEMVDRKVEMMDRNDGQGKGKDIIEILLIIY